MRVRPWDVNRGGVSGEGREMSAKPVFLTKEGRAKIEAELKNLREVRRLEIAERIRVAKEYSDTGDTAEFDEAKNEQAFVEGRILTLESMLANAVIIDEDNRSKDAVRIGSRVTILDDEGAHEQYTIVGSAEANAKAGRISNESPVGRALLGKCIGDRVEVIAPAGVMGFTVTAIE
jgi:transcription elongation factor GreA